MVNNSKNTPIYDLAIIQLHVNAMEFNLANARARTKVKELGWDSSMIKSFIIALNESHFQRVFTDQSAYDGRKLLDVDAYKMHFNESNKCVGSSRDCCFWVKLALEKNTSGNVVAVVSIHLDGSP